MPPDPSMDLGEVDGAEALLRNSRTRRSSRALFYEQSTLRAIAPADLVRAIAFAFALAFAGAVGAIALSQPAAMDFIAHYASASLVLQGRGASILDPDAILAAERAAAPAREQLLPWLQVPALALIRAPLALLPFETAFAIVAALDVVMIVSAVALLAPRGRAIAAMLIAAPASSLAVAHAQTSPLVLLLVALALRVGPRGAGLALGLCLLRVQSAPLLLLAGLLDPARRLWTAIGALAVVALSAAVVGLDGLVRYAASLAAGTDYLRTGEYGMRAAVGWSGLAFWIGMPSLGVVASGISLAIGAAVLVRASAAERPRVAAAWTLLVAPNLYVHDAVLAYPLLAAIASRHALWDAASVLVWLAHVLLAPLGVLWSAVLAIVAARRALAVR